MRKLIFLIVLSALWAQVASGAVNVQRNSDGSYYTAVLSNGSTSLKYDIVFIGDGFTAAQQADFNARVNDAVAALQAMPPYSQRMCGLNIWRVNVISAESGVDHPKDGVFRNTELDCRYGNPSAGEAERCIRSDSPAKCYEAADYAPDYDAVFVLVNDTQWGGCAGGLVFSSISPGFAGIITHELGHKIGALADEYDCYVCDGSDANRTYVGPEPASANLTKQTARAAIKWNDLIAATTPLPTTVNTPPGVVGIWEGGGYNRFGIFRPQLSCHMRSSGNPFCAVCEREMRTILSGNCTRCELNPGSVYCLFIDWSRYKLVWQRPFRLRWPLPPCLTCPPDVLLFDDIVIVLEQLPQGFQVQVLDARGQVVAEGRPSEKGLQVAFKSNRAQQYFVEVISGDQASGETLTLTPQLFRNGRLEDLPE